MVKTDRDLLAEWAGEELAGSSAGTAAEREAHAARNRFYLEMLRVPFSAVTTPQGTAAPPMR